MLLYGRPKFHAGQTTGPVKEVASQIINPSPVVMNLGELLRHALREFSTPVTAIIEPNTGRLYVFPVGSSATSDFYVELDTLSHDVTLRPEAGQSGPLLAWEKAPGTWSNEPAGAAVAYTAVKPKRTVGALIQSLAVNVALDDGGVAPVLVIDQTTGHVAVYRGSAGAVAACVASWDAVETPSGDMAHLYFAPVMGGPGRDQYFESGP